MQNVCNIYIYIYISVSEDKIKGSGRVQREERRIVCFHNPERFMENVPLSKKMERGESKKGTFLGGPPKNNWELCISRSVL
jgi:hypothetical protein